MTGKGDFMRSNCTFNFMGGNTNLEQNGVTYSINGKGHIIQMAGDNWIVDGEPMTIDEMVAKGIAAKDGDRAEGKAVTIIVNGNVRKLQTAKGDITVNGMVEGDAVTNFGNITCGDIHGDAISNFGSIHRK